MVLLAGWSVATPLYAELSDEQKRELYLESQSSSVTSSSASSSTHPHATPTPHSKPKATPKSTPHAKKLSSGSGTHSASGSVIHHHPSASAATPHATGTHAVTKVKSASPTPALQTSEPAPHPAEVTQPTPALSTMPAAIPLPASSLPHGANPSAPITIQKSGIDQAQGLEPAPEAAHSGLFGWLFGGSATHRSYSYLNAATRAAIDHAPVRRGRWKYIIVHNSGTREGNAHIFDIYHFRVRHMVNGLAYHFVIGDGHGSGDGQIEIGHRWTAQLQGGHVASDYLNDISLGICLVGDFNRDLPTKAQMGALEELIEYLRDRVGKSQGRRAIIYAHKEINPRPTDCPGDRFPYSWLHAKFR